MRKCLIFHLNDYDEIRRVYLQRGSCVPFSHDFLKKKKKVERCINLILIGLKNTKLVGTYFVYIVIYLSKMLIIE